MGVLKNPGHHLARIFLIVERVDIVEKIIAVVLVDTVVEFVLIVRHTLQPEFFFLRCTAAACVYSERGTLRSLISAAPSPQRFAPLIGRLFFVSKCSTEQIGNGIHVHMISTAPVAVKRGGVYSGYWFMCSDSGAIREAALIT